MTLMCDVTPVFTFSYVHTLSIETPWDLKLTPKKHQLSLKLCENILIMFKADFVSIFIHSHSQPQVTPGLQVGHTCQFTVLFWSLKNEIQTFIKQNDWGFRFNWPYTLLRRSNHVFSFLDYFTSKIIYVFYLCVCVCVLVWICVNHIHAMLIELEYSVNSPGTGFSQLWAASYRCWE